MSEGWREYIDRVHQEFEFRERHLTLMHDIDLRILDHEQTLADTLRFIIAELRATLGADNADILFEHADGLRIEISTDQAEEQRFIPTDRSISGRVFASHQPFVANELDEVDPYFPRLGHLEEDSEAVGLRVLVAPITVENQVVGVINVEGGQMPFTDTHRDFVTSIASQVSLAISHAALFDEDNLRRQTDALLLDNASSDSEFLVRLALESIIKTLTSFGFIQADAAEVLFVDPQDDNLLMVTYSTNSDARGVRVGMNDSICGQAFTRRETVIVANAREHEFYQPIQRDMCCEIAIPIQLGGDQQFPIGVLNIESRQENAFSVVARVLAERFARRVMTQLALTKLRTDLDSVGQDQFLMAAADQVLNAVHRINNDAGGARIVSQGLLDELETGHVLDPVDLRRRLTLVRDSAARAQKIPEELRRRLRAQESSVDFNAQVEAGLRDLPIPRSIELLRELTPRLPELPCSGLDLVVENVVTNALQAMAGDGGVVRVRTEREERGGQTFIVLRVSDNGPGMTTNQLRTLFERRDSEVAVGRGLGFGMPWVKAWVRRSHGVLDVDSRLGDGTDVTIGFQLDPRISQPLSQNWRN